MIEELKGLYHREGQGLGLWVLVVTEAGGVVVAKAAAVVGIVKALVTNLRAAGGDAVSEVSHTVCYAGWMLCRGLKAGSDSYAPSEVGLVGVVEEVIHSVSYFDVGAH